MMHEKKLNSLTLSALTKVRDQNIVCILMNLISHAVLVSVHLRFYLMVVSLLCYFVDFISVFVLYYVK